MTNAERYLKDEASIDEVAEAFEKFCMNFNNYYAHTYSEEMRGFFRADCKPTLTEDKRAVLSTMDEIYAELDKTSNNYSALSYKTNLDNIRLH